MEDKTAPRPGCTCDVCNWANRRMDRERRLADDLEANYRRFTSGELVSRDGKE
jgi:hypothetical protein